MYRHLTKENIPYYLPKTYTRMENVDKSIFDGEKLFLKTYHGSGGKTVTCSNNYEKFDKILKEKGTTDFILQEEIENPY